MKSRLLPINFRRKEKGSTPLRKGITRLTRAPLLHNIAVVASGTAGAQIMAMLFTPAITRLYGPDPIGVLGTFNAIIMVITPIAALSYPIAIILPKDDREAFGISQLSIYLSICVAFLIGLIVLLLHDTAAIFFNLGKASELLILVPLAVPFIACVAVGKQWAIRSKQFAFHAKTTAAQATLLNSAKAGAGLIKPVSATLIIVTILASITHALILAIGMRKRIISALRSSKEKIPLKSLALKYIDFPLFRAPQAFISAASKGLPVLMLATFYGATEAGFYALGISVLTLPITLIGKSVTDVFYPKLNEQVTKGRRTDLIFKTTLGLALIGIFPFGLIMAFGPWLFAFVFGNEWWRAGEYASWLSVWSYFGFVNRASVGAIPVLSIQALFLLYEIISVILRGASLVFGFYVFKDDLVAIIMFSIAGALLNISLIGLVLTKSYSQDRIRTLQI